MNHKRITTIALKSILAFVVLVGGQGSTLASRNASAAAEAPEPYLVKDINAMATGPPLLQLTNVDGTLYFSAFDGVHGYELWVSDGTADGTQLVKDIRPGDEGFGPGGLTSVNGNLFFSADDGVHGSELWKSDGTADSTQMVKDIRPGIEGSCCGHLTDVNGTLFFSASDGVHGGLWKSDGTVSGTVLVKEIDRDYLTHLTDVNGTLFFVADDGVHGVELWVSDGTTNGTYMVKDIRPGFESSLPGGWSGVLTSVNGKLFFSADDGLHGNELWVSDGAAEGTVLVKDIRPGAEGSCCADLTGVNGNLFFGAYDGIHGSELWKSDGTADGTQMVKDIRPGVESSGPIFLTNVDGTLFFHAVDGVHGRELWKSDGTANGTVLVKDINPGDDSYPEELTDVNGTLFFRAWDGVHGGELWVSDGIAEGTVLVKDIYPGNDGYDPSVPQPRELTNVNGTLFFSANDGIHGDELWALQVTPAASITVTPTSGLITTEGGGTDTFTVVLTSQPTADVTIGLSSSDTTEGTLSKSSLTFTPTNWDQSRTVKVTGVNDDEVDSDITYSIITAPATSSDPNYSGLNPPDISATNEDNDVAGIMVSPTSEVVTGEDGVTDTFTIVLTSQPSADVTIGLSSSDTSEGTLSKSSLTFASTNWDVPQTVTITCVDDEEVDGDITYTIITAPANSADSDYDGLNAVDISVTNLDDDETVFRIFLPLLNDE